MYRKLTLGRSRPGKYIRKYLDKNNKVRYVYKETEDKKGTDENGSKKRSTEIKTKNVQTPLSTVGTYKNFVELKSGAVNTSGKRITNKISSISSIKGMAYLLEEGKLGFIKVDDPKTKKRKASRHPVQWNVEQNLSQDTDVLYMDSQYGETKPSFIVFNPNVEKTSSYLAESGINEWLFSESSKNYLITSGKRLLKGKGWDIISDEEDEYYTIMVKDNGKTHRIKVNPKFEGNS